MFIVQCAFKNFHRVILEVFPRFQPTIKCQTGRSRNICKISIHTHAERNQLPDSEFCFILLFLFVKRKQNQKKRISSIKENMMRHKQQAQSQQGNSNTEADRKHCNYCHRFQKTVRKSLKYTQRGSEITKKGWHFRQGKVFYEGNSKKDDECTTEYW